MCIAAKNNYHIILGSARSEPNPNNYNILCQLLFYVIKKYSRVFSIKTLVPIFLLETFSYHFFKLFFYITVLIKLLFFYCTNGSLPGRKVKLFLRQQVTPCGPLRPRVVHEVTLLTHGICNNGKETLEKMTLTLKEIWH